MARTTARAAVMQMIFEHMAGGEGGEETLQMVYEALRKEGLPGVDSISENEPSESDRAYITKVLDGVLAHLDELDEAIQAASPRWEISRMPHVDLTILRMAALLSINLGIMNILPFPALDGGKVVFLLIEGVTGHAVPEKIQSGLTLAAFALFFGLMLFATYNDILRLITGAV